jgi:hypothetical protein
LFPGSSVVEQPAVNRLVAGSNPARGANKIKDLEEKRSRQKGGFFIRGNIWGNNLQIHFSVNPALFWRLSGRGRRSARACSELRFYVIGHCMNRDLRTANYKYLFEQVAAVFPNVFVLAEKGCRGPTHWNGTRKVVQDRNQEWRDAILRELKDSDARAVILQKLYELRDEMQWVTPKELQAEYERLGGGQVVTQLMSQLAEYGLIEWQPHLSRGTGTIDFFAGRIVTTGIEVIEGSREPPIAISVEMDFERLNTIVDSSDASQTEKETAKSIFKMLSENKIAQWALLFFSR